MCFNKTDRKVSSNIWMAQSVLNNDKAILIAKLIKATLPEYRKLLKFPKDIKFRVGPIKKRTATGRYWSRSKTVEICTSQTPEQALISLAHELVHAEQYHQGRLQNKWKDRIGWVCYWNGKVNKSRGATFNSYMKQPWEVEAYSRQESLALAVHNSMIKKIEKQNEKKQSRTQRPKNTQV
jgi:hypothetical protein